MTLQFCLLVALMPCVVGQVAEHPQEPGSIAGVVLNDLTSQPLKRAQVVLRPAQSGLTAFSQSTGVDGAFSFPRVAPGRYSILTERDGFLPASSGFLGHYRMPESFRLEPGQSLRDLTVRLHGWGLIAGKIRFEDAEPAVDIAVQIYAESFWRGRRSYRVAGGTRTNDLGEYRIHNLAPGVYYVAALYDRPALVPTAEPQPRLDASGKTLPDLSYAVTFYPSVQKLMDAVPVRVAYGQESDGIDIFLEPLETFHIRGHVRSGVSGQLIPAPSITLARIDAELSGAVTAPSDVTLDRSGGFEIKNVAPGPYALIVDSTDERGRRLAGRHLLTVGNASIDGLDILAAPEQIWKGNVHFETKVPLDTAGLHVVLEPRSDTAHGSQAQVAKDGSFSLPFIPEETYDLYVENEPETLYLKSARLASMDVLRNGLQAASGGNPVPIELVLSDTGGIVSGRVITADSDVSTGASLALIPDPPEGRYQAYRKASADERGEYIIPGVPPGKYIVVAWDVEPPCSIYDPDSLAECRAAGVAIKIEEGEQQHADVTLK